jgi:hypothetical protein
MSASRRDLVVRGIVAGAIGYAVVAILFGIVDYLYGRPAYATATYLGARITARALPAVQPFEPALVIAFNALHLLLMVGAGLLGSLLVHRSNRAGLLPFFAFLAGAVAALLASFVLAAGLLGSVYAVDLVWTNLAAAAAAISYLVVRSDLQQRSHAGRS